MTYPGVVCGSSPPAEDLSLLVVVLLVLIVVGALQKSHFKLDGDEILQVNAHRLTEWDF